MTGVAVVGHLRWLVTASEANEVGDDHPVTGGNQRWDHVAIEVAPRWLTVHQQHDGTVGSAFVEIVDPQRATVAIGYFGVVRFKWVTG